MASSYAEARTKVAPRRKGPRCTMCTLLDGLSVEDRAGVEADLENPLVRGSLIGNALSEMGHPIGQHVLDRHRRGGCTP